MDVDEVEQVAAACGISAMPTFQVRALFYVGLCLLGFLLDSVLLGFLLDSVKLC